MKTHLTFRSPFLVFLMAVLIFSTPFTTFAEQNSVEVQAERDAKADVKEPLWFIAGVGASCGGIICCGTATGAFNFDLLSPPPPISELVSVAWSGAGVGCLLPLTLGYSYQPGPPPDRFIGKSPEYIDLYTEFYKKKAQQRRVSSAAIGAAVPPLIYTVLLLHYRT